MATLIQNVSSLRVRFHMDRLSWLLADATATDRLEIVGDGKCVSAGGGLAAIRINGCNLRNYQRIARGNKGCHMAFSQILLAQSLHLPSNLSKSG